MGRPAAARTAAGDGRVGPSTGGAGGPQRSGEPGRDRPVGASLGADGLVLDPTCADPHYRRSVRVSMGEILHLPVARAAMSATLAELDAAGFEVWALTLVAMPHRSTSWHAGVPGRLALVMGAEGPGLSDAVLGSCLPCASVSATTSTR
ncbi:MAG: TrmH family RNA methyltransferase [Ilumatobacteraceae bacterium]